MDKDYFALAALVITMLIPIIAILTHHQRKMAELIHKNRGTNDASVDRLEQEVRELKQLVLAQTIALDNVGLQRPRGDALSVESRLHS